MFWIVDLGQRKSRIFVSVWIVIQILEILKDSLFTIVVISKGNQE